ncbi:unnamed protein product [Arabidopsis thaliana]|uniref:(thale cress) hypothetical protein n=1 Tax=Arabidopsis thaliana TaxID=3702 RepID=A0A7G2ECK4_ARATH|nr:unnamed protein product [Arabidopsis thaliana]
MDPQIKKSLASTSKSCEVMGRVVQANRSDRKNKRCTLDFESEPVLGEDSPEEKERQKKGLDTLKKSVNDSVRMFKEESKNEEIIPYLLEEVKAGKRRTEDYIFRVKNEVEKAKKKQDAKMKKK